MHTTHAEGEARSERTIRDTFATVHGWHTSARFIPSPGSELALDDLDWPPMPFTDTMRLELDLAAEQFHQVHVMLDAGELSLTSQRVLVRTALIASSIALWLVLPDDAAERRNRHRRLVEQNHFRHLQALQAQLRLEEATGVVQPNLAKMVVHVRKGLKAIQDKRAADGQVSQWNDSDVIRDAALYAFREEPDPVALSNEALFEFRSTSGAAHALPWALFNSPGMHATTPVDEHGRAVMVATPQWGDLANSYMAAFLISRASWRLLAVRGR